MRIEPFTEEHDALRETIRRWVQAELTPHVAEWDDADIFPREVFTRAAELGFLGLDADPEYGGQGGDYWATVVWGEELGRSGGGSVPMALGVQTDMATPPLRRFGTPEQKRQWLEPALRGEKIAAIAISEPDAGSDVAGIRTRAVRDGDGWILNGAKTYITNGTRADFCVMVVRTSGEPGDHEGVSLFIVDTSLPGFSVAKKLDKMGMRASDTAELSMVDMRLPGDALLGEEGMGFAEIMWQLQGERLIGASQAIGTAEELLERAMAYGRERRAFGRPIGTFQVQRHRLAEIATRVEAMKRLVYDTAQGWEAGAYPTLSIAMSKLAAAQTVNWVADEVLQLHGGYGYTEESGIPRLWRDNRLLRIGGGADEVQLEVIGKLIERGGITDPALAPLQVGDAASSENSGVGVQPVWTAEHEALRKTARRFVETEITPNVPAWEDARDYPRELFRTVGDAGFFGLCHDERWGGSGPDFAAKAVWVTELARCGSGGLAADLGAHSDLAALYIDRSGTDAQRERWLVPSITGEVIGALGITEPDAGSDVAGTRTRAVRDGDDWIINGAKTFITNGPWADHVVVLCTTDPEAGAAGKTLFIVEAGTPGFERQRLSMLGWHTGHTGELSFTDVRVPDENRLGEVGSGFYAVMRNFAWERVMMSLGAVAAAEECLQDAMQYGRDRQAFSRPIGTFQTWRHRFAHQATQIAMGRALTEHALRITIAEEAGPAEKAGPAAIAAAKAKLFTQRLAVEVADWNVQIHGGAGYMREYAAQRWLRDARLGPIGGGTDEIMAEIIGKSMGF